MVKLCTFIHGVEMCIYVSILPFYIRKCNVVFTCFLGSSIFTIILPIFVTPIAISYVFLIFTVTHTKKTPPRSTPNEFSLATPFREWAWWIGLFVQTRFKIRHLLPRNILFRYTPCLEWWKPGKNGHFLEGVKMAFLAFFDTSNDVLRLSLTCQNSKNDQKWGIWYI